MAHKAHGMGADVKRKEDARFIRGRGNYIDDIKLPGMLWLDMVDGVPQYKIDDPKAIAVYQRVGDMINKGNCQINKDQGDSLAAGEYQIRVQADDGLRA